MKKRCVALVWASMLAGLVSPAWAGDRLDRLRILKEEYPRAFFFRQTEGLARIRKMPFEEWDKTFARLNGIMGKSLDEEVPNTSAGCIPYFTQFKRLHPDQAVLLHYNGNSRDPRFDAGEFFAGHWIYFNGCRLTKDLPAEQGESVIHVEDPALFATQMGLYGTSNDDLGICALRDGRPDWAVSEQLELLEVDRAKGALRVRRGAFGTKPLALDAASSYIAAHLTEGPWGKKSNLLWFYNYSTVCPKDSKGRTCADVLVEDLAKHFAPAGDLAAFDGLEFDVLGFGHMTARIAKRGLDVDADGRADGGIIGGINAYGIGVYEFCAKLRERLGDDLLIMADGASPSNQRSFGLLNGIESEGWPHLSDHTVNDWSGGLNRHFYWRNHAHTPPFSYVNHKFVEGIPGKKGEHRNVPTPFSLSRLVFAACMFTDSAITYCVPCPPGPGEKLGIYDELRMGVEDRTNWLAKPSGPPVRLALQSPDLLKGEWAKAAWRSSDPETRIAQQGEALSISGKSRESEMMAWRLEGMDFPAGDIFIHAAIRGETMSGYPSGVARLLWVSVMREGDVMDARPPVTGMALRGGKETPMDPASGAVVRDLADIEIGGAKHPAYFIHPPWRAGAGYVFWEAETAVPAGGGELRFYTGLSDKPPSKSDGVTFKVVVCEQGGSKEIFNYHHAERVWKEHAADLSAWSGRRTRLRFIADCGPKDNTTADQGAWACVGVATAGQAWRSPKTSRFMAWVGSEDTEASFYFRDLGPSRVDVRFEIEGAEPVVISGLTMHAHADAIAREFEHGVVLANPSDREYTFDLKKLFPGRQLRRLQGSPQQDLKTNDGQPAADRLTLAPRDAIFLRD